MHEQKIFPLLSPWVDTTDRAHPNYRLLEAGAVAQITSDFDNVLKWMTRTQKKHLPTTDITATDLANLTLDLLAYQEEHFSMASRNPAIVRLPTKYFFDVRVSGALGYILVAVLRFKRDKQIKDFSFKNPAFQELHTELFMAIEKQLVSSDFLKRPNVYLSKEISEPRRTKLSEIIRRNQGHITSDKASATHLVFDCLTNFKHSSDAKNLYVEPLCKLTDSEGKKWVYLHHIGYPDSFDTWQPATGPSWSSAPETFEWAQMQVACAPKFTSKKRNDDREPVPWRVTIEWIYDLEKFNEWPNEKDYEVDEKRRAMTLDMMKSTIPQRKILSLKLLKKSKRSLEVLDSEIEPKKAKENESMDDRMVDDVPAAEPATLINMSLQNGIEALYDESAEGLPDQYEIMEQQHHIIVPSYAAWFDYNSIHSIEKRALPEFFSSDNESKTPEIYVGYRNFMIDTYRLSPVEYLSATAVRRNLAGDVCSILRVHAFLEQWGLVNYQVDSDSKPTPIGPPATSHFHLLADTPSGIQPVALQKRKNLSTESTTKPKIETIESKQPIAGMILAFYVVFGYPTSCYGRLSWNMKIT